MARVILGLTGSGKSYKIAEEAASVIDGGSLKPRAKIYIIVPDQYTVSSEKFYLDILGEQRFSHVRLMSFKRLANYIFKQVGGKYVGISKCSRNVLCEKAVKLASPAFVYYNNKKFSIDFIKRLVNIFSQFKTAGITAADFGKTAALLDSPRLNDIAAVYFQYQSFFDSGLFDSNDIYSKVCELLETENLFSDDVFYFDNFRTVNPGERSVINAVCKQSQNVTVALPYTERNSDNVSLLSGVAQSGEALIAFLEKNGSDVQIDVIKESIRFISPDIAHLAKNVFSDDVRRYGDKSDNIRLYKAADLYDEVEAAAAEISRLVADCGYSYSDICVTARDMDIYAPYLASAFNMYDVPFFAHKKTGMLHMPLVVFVSSLLTLAADGYSESAIIALLKTEFLNVSRADSLAFETYLKTWKTAVNNIKNDFVYKPSGFSASEKNDESTLASVNRVRQEIVRFVEDFKAAAEDKTVSELCEQLYDVFNRVNVKSKLEDIQQKFLSVNDRIYSEQARVYGMLITAMEDLCSVAGNDKVPLSVFSDLLMSAIDGEQISVIPTAINEVLTGNIGNLPFMSPKCTFILGMDNNSFPSAVSEDPLIRFNDIESLRRHGIEYGMTDKDYAVLDRYLAYVAVTSPREKLYILYSADGGKSVSPYVKNILDCFVDGAIKEDVSPYISGKGFESRIRNEKSAFSVMSRTGSGLLRDYFVNNSAYSGLINNPDRNGDKLSPETSRALFGDEIYLSATSVSNFFECRFKYFIEKGMRFPDERSSELGALETGNYIHHVLELIVPRFGKDINTDEDIKNAVGNITKQYMSELIGDKLPNSLESYINILKSQASRLAHMFKEVIDDSQFIPIFFEKKIDSSSPEYSIDGRNVYVAGIIDRVDKYEKDGKTYVTVNDYKTGEKKFDLNNIYNGLDIQMLLYLKKILAEMKKEESYDVLPAGAAYLRAKASINEVERNKGFEEAYRNMKESNLPSGILLDDVDVNSAVGYDKKNIKYIQSDQYEIIFGYIGFLLQKMTKAIVNGDIAKNPLDKKDSYDKKILMACRYCKYVGLCEHYGCVKQFEKPKDAFLEMKQEVEQNAPMDQ